MTTDKNHYPVTHLDGLARQLLHIFLLIQAAYELRNSPREHASGYASPRESAMRPYAPESQISGISSVSFARSAVPVSERTGCQ
jgi:hypothetical protein